MTPKDAAATVRDNRSILASAEKRALCWMARRLPSAVNSDHLSAIGLASMATAGLSFAAFPFSRWAAAGVVASLAANWFGDSLDGTLARVRNQQRPRYGFYVDHVIDIAGSTFLFAGAACSGIMSPLVSMGILVAYLLVSAETYLATHCSGVFRMSFMGFGPTELRILLAVGVLRVAWSPWVSIGGYSLRLFDVGGVIGIAGMVVAFVVASIRNTQALYLAEPLPERSRTKAA